MISNGSNQGSDYFPLKSSHGVEDYIFKLSSTRKEISIAAANQTTAGSPEVNFEEFGHLMQTMSSSSYVLILFKCNFYLGKLKSNKIYYQI
jgi:hypothetical protein